MRSLLIAILVTCYLIPVTCKAQTNIYHPFPDSNSVWNETSWYFTSSPPYNAVSCPQILFLAGDTIISTLHYKKILGSGYCQSQSTCCYYYNVYQGALRQDSIHKKVYYRNNSLTAVDTVLYNFNLNVGDTLPVGYNNYRGANYVSSIDSILIGTNYRKQYHISVRGSTSYSDSNYVSLIEGIGSTLGLTYQIFPPFEAGSYLNCFTQNNVQLYTNPMRNCDLTIGIKAFNTQNSTFQIYPNPATNIISIDGLPLNEKTHIQIIDMFGNFVSELVVSDKTNVMINVSGLSEGVYNIRITNTEGSISKRVVLVN